MIDTDERLRTIQDRQEIHDALMRISRGVDRLDRDLIISGYHPDAIDRHGSFEGSPAAFADWVIGRHRGNIQSCMHCVVNEYVEISGNTAQSESYVICLYRMADNGQLIDIFAPGRYLDKLEKRNGEWKVIERLTLFEKDRIDPVTRISEGPLTEMLVKSRRDREDAVYSFLSFKA